MPKDGIIKCSHNDIISLEEVAGIVKAATKFGIKKIRLTGGEPLVRKGILKLCKDISNLKEIEELCITTNGSLLKDKVKDFKDAGVNRINFSLDSLNPEKFSYITRGGKVEDTLAAINEAIDLGLGIKINTVLIGGFNEDDIKGLVDFTKNNKLQVRFIELMKMGETLNWPKEKFISNKIVLEKVPELVENGKQGVANIYKIPGYLGTVGLISPISSCFCKECNRIRLTADGKLKPCLHSNSEIDLKNLSDKELDMAIEKAIYNKPKSHNLINGTTETRRNMNAIGG